MGDIRRFPGCSEATGGLVAAELARVPRHRGGVRRSTGALRGAVDRRNAPVRSIAVPAGLARHQRGGPGDVDSVAVPAGRLRPFPAHGLDVLRFLRGSRFLAVRRQRRYRSQRPAGANLAVDDGSNRTRGVFLDQSHNLRLGRHERPGAMRAVLFQGADSPGRFPGPIPAIRHRFAHPGVHSGGWRAAGNDRA